MLGLIHPFFFLLPHSRGEYCRVQCMKTGRPRDNGMPYKLETGKMTIGPLSICLLLWSSHMDRGGSYIYHTPINMLNSIIRLQPVVEIIINKIAKTLNILAKQQNKMHNAIYQNCLGLGYLLASEGGIHGKFNLSNFCLQIGDEGNIIEEIIGQMRKITHVQVQTCRGWNPKNLFG